MLVAVPRPEYHCHGHPSHSVAVRSQDTMAPYSGSCRVAYTEKSSSPAHKD